MTEQKDPIANEVFTLVTLGEAPWGELRPIPVVTELFGEGSAEWFIFGEKDRAEEFMASPDMDVPAIIKALTLQQLLDLLRAFAECEFPNKMVVDATPPHTWGSGDEEGQIYSVDEAMHIMEMLIQKREKEQDA